MLWALIWSNCVFCALCCIQFYGKKDIYIYTHTHHSPLMTSHLVFIHASQCLITFTINPIIVLLLRSRLLRFSYTSFSYYFYFLPTFTSFFAFFFFYFFFLFFACVTCNAKIEEMNKLKRRDYRVKWITLRKHTQLDPQFHIERPHNTHFVLALVLIVVSFYNYFYEQGSNPLRPTVRCMKKMHWIFFFPLFHIENIVWWNSQRRRYVS